MLETSIRSGHGVDVRRRIGVGGTPFIRHVVPTGDQLSYEVVERKGLGHPDTLCDQIADRASVKYTNYCLRTFGRPAHHWFDKVMLIGGECKLEFGAAQLLNEFEVIFAGKGVRRVGSDEIPMDDLLREAAAEVLDTTLVGFHSSTDLRTSVRVSNFRGPGQAGSRYRPMSVSEMPTPNGTKVSNDCNLCVGYAPLSILERSVLEIERYLNGWPAAGRDIGSDIKVVGFRHEREIDLVVNVPLLANRVASQDAYFDRVRELETIAADRLASTMGIAPTIVVNPEKSSGRAYLTRTGTAADTGDIGVTGRGNRCNGLITPMRPMSIEASAGKNPLDHTGKIYNVVAQLLADRVHNETGASCYAIIATTKERPLADPNWIVVHLDNPRPRELQLIDDILADLLTKLDDITRALMAGEFVQW